MTTVTNKLTYTRVKHTPRTEALGIVGCECRDGIVLLPTAGYQGFLEVPDLITDDEVEKVEFSYLEKE